MVDKKQRKKTKKSNLKLVFIFCLLVFSLIFFSASLKIFAVLKSSRFDGEHRFNVLFLSGKKPSFLISLEPSTKSLSNFSLSGNLPQNIKDSEFGAVIDGRIKCLSDKCFKTNPADNFWDVFWHSKDFQTNLTKWDLLRLFWAARNIPAENIHFKNVNLEHNKILPRKDATDLADAQILKEAKTIQIINASGQEGRGWQLERIISSLGGVVVSVESALTPSKKSKTSYYTDSSYTLTRINSFLHFPLVKMNKKGISDILILVGEDSLSKKEF